MFETLRLSRIGASGLHLEPTQGSEANKVCGPLVSPVPLPLGEVSVTALDHLDGLPRDIDSDQLQITVYGQKQDVLLVRTAKGRAGLNDLYEDVVGYRPDDDDVLDSHSLLCLVVETIYRDTCGDMN